MYKNLEVWFATGSQHLYGQETLKQVAKNSQQIVNALNASGQIPVKIIWKETLTNPDAITQLCLDANASPKCIGLITWMHTFSPAKMWISGLKILNKPLLHLHTQFNQDLPWNTIDMDFMNLNQSAHGGREFGFITTRMRIKRKVVVGHWNDKDVQNKINVWTRAAAAWNDTQNMKIARFGDNMREVAVTEGDKVSTQIKLGYSVNGFGIGDLVKYIKHVDTASINNLIDEYETLYQVQKTMLKGGAEREKLRQAAAIELGIKLFLEDGGFKGFTTTFENLHGLTQLPGLAVQRLMAKGYGFGAEGDWKTAALVRALKVMSDGLPGGTSFMEDYTYHLNPSGMKVLGSHMLEVCESISGEKPSLEIHPLSIGGKEDPPRLVFNVSEGSGLNASIIDLGNRLRMIVNEINVEKPTNEFPKLPVARAIWEALPDLKTAATAWIYAGGAHHTAFTKALSPEHLYDFSEMAGIEYLLIDKNTKLHSFKDQLRANDLYYHMSSMFNF